MAGKHFLKLLYPTGQGNVFYISYFGMFVNYLILDNRGFPISPDEFHFDTETLLSSSKVSDEFGNKEVSHHYLAGTINCIVESLRGFQWKKSPGNYESVAWLYKDGWSDSGRFNQIIPGTGYKSPGMNYEIVTESTPSACTREWHAPDGRLLYTVRYTLLDSLPQYIDDSWVKIRFREVVTVEEWAKRKFPNSYRDSDSVKTYNSVWTKLTSYTASDIDPQKILSLLEITSATSSRPSIRPSSFVDDLYGKFTIPDVNNCENLKDLRDIKKSIPPIINVLKKRSLKSLSQLYLWYKYSYSTSKLDLEAYMKFIYKWFQDQTNTKSYRKTPLTYHSVEYGETSCLTQVTRYHVYTDTYSCGIIQSLGLELNLSNTWDMIPFSFVVDWFINLGDIFARIDHIGVLGTVKIRSVVESNKCIYVCSPLSSLGIFGSCTVVSYNRTVSKSIPSDIDNISLKNPFHHIIDGAALIFANKR